MSVESESEQGSSSSIKTKQLFEIDYVGNETFVVTSLNLLCKRSDEPIKGNEAKLSARGLHHRNKEKHYKDFASSNAIITNSQMREKKEKKAKISAQLVPPLFQRALALERMKQLHAAINDYSMILRVDKNASAYFNRSGLWNALGNHTRALADLNEAIKLDPLNVAYRSNKALILRSHGQYFDAINETMVGRAIVTLPEFVKAQVESGKELLINSSQLRKLKPPPDPVVDVLTKPRELRTPKSLECVVDFLSKLKFFAPFIKDNALMQSIAMKVELNRYEQGDPIFEEGMKGEHFYMVLDGEVSIVKCKKNIDGYVVSTTVLVVLFRGQTFGETALESVGGFRTAGALATSKTGTALLSMHVDDYKSIILGYKLVLRGEVRQVLKSCPAFVELSQESLDTLAESAVLRNFGIGIEIFQAGDPSKHLYILKQGIVRLTKEIPKPSIAGVKVDVRAGQTYEQTPGLWVLEKSYKDPRDESMYGSNPNRAKQNAIVAEMGIDQSTLLRGKGGKTLDVTVGVLASGQLFGELAVLSPGLASPLTATSFTPAEVYCFTSETMIAAGVKFSQQCMSALLSGISLHNPPPEKLAHYYREKYAAESLKQGTLLEMNTYADRSHR